MINNIVVVEWRWRSGQGILVVDTKGKRIKNKQIEAINAKLNEITGYGIDWFDEDEPAANIIDDYKVMEL